MIKWKKLLQKNQLIILLLIGILLVVIAIPTGTEAENKTDETAESLTENSTDKIDMEKRLKTFLEQIEGAGNVEVMITYKDNGEKIVEKDEGETTVYHSASGGEESPYVKQELSPEVEGVAVIAEGAGSAVVVRAITETVQALFDVDTHKIRIMKGG